MKIKNVTKHRKHVLGQIAFGVDASATSNPDIWDIFKHCRENGVVPNLTVADIDDEVADKIASLAGACAVSLYDDKNICYDSVKKLTDRGMNQVNIHFCYHSGNYYRIDEIVEDIKDDPRLKNLNAIVFLALKQKGRGKGFEPLAFHRFKEMVEFVIDSGISYGFDSCSAQSLLRAIKGTSYIEKIEKYIESCESTRMSLYIDVDGFFYPCSFMEKIDDWKDGLDVKTCNDFISEIWENPRTQNFRKGCLSSIKNGVGCQYYNI